VGDPALRVPSRNGRLEFQKERLVIDESYGAIDVDCLEFVGEVPAGERVEGEGDVAACDFGGGSSGEGAIAVGGVAPVVGGAEGAEEFVVGGAFEGGSVDIDAEKVFPLGAGKRLGVMAGVVHGVGAEGESDAAEVGGADGDGGGALGAGDGDGGDGDEDGRDGDGDESFGEGEGAARCRVGVRGAEDERRVVDVELK
jgi:hypothetical protein